MPLEAGNLNRAYSWAVETCNAPNVGYSQSYRNRQTVNGITYYDCSSFIWWALKEGGFDVVSANLGNDYPVTTANMGRFLQNLQFSVVPLTSEWLAGDILWRSGHAEMVYRGGQASGISMGAHSANVALDAQVSISRNETTADNWTTLFRYGDSGAAGYGSTLYVVAAICGNFWQESTINPAIWESLETAAWSSLSHGYGLGQWTNVNGDTHGRLYQLYEWMTENGYEMDDGNGQLSFLVQENLWLPSDEYGEQFGSLQEFLTSDSTDLELLTHAWNNAWEGIHDASWDTRVEYAQRCLEYITAHAQDTSITGWITGNRYLSEEETLNNAVMVYRWLSAGGGGGGNPAPVKKRKGMPLWMKIKYKY